METIILEAVISQKITVNYAKIVYRCLQDIQNRIDHAKNETEWEYHSNRYSAQKDDFMQALNRK